MCCVLSSKFKEAENWQLATLLEGAGLAFDIHLKKKKKNFSKKEHQN